MHALKHPTRLDLGGDSAMNDPWDAGFQLFDGFTPPGLDGPNPPGASDKAHPNARALSAPPFREPPSATYALDGSERVLSDTLASNASKVTTIGTTKATSTTTTSGGASTTSPFVINIGWDASVANAPAGFQTAVIAAVNYLESQFVDPVTINIDVGYGEVNGSALSSNELGSSYYWLNSVSYSTLVGALKSDATDATDASVVNSLPSTSPVNGTFWTTTAEAKALGLASPTNTAIDGYVGFSSSLPFTYNDANGVASGTYDFNGTVLHEITEVMGRALLTDGTIGSTSNSYYLDDLLHYSAPGIRDFSASTPGYFSPNGGTTNDGGFNTVAGGDAGDWGSSMGNDSANAFSNPGVVNSFSADDVTEMDAIGWNLAGSVAPPPAPPPPPPPVGPTGVSVAAMTASLANAVALASPIAKLNQVGGTTGHTFTYTLGGSGASAFSVSSSGNVGTLMSGANGLVGSTTGTLYALTVTANDVTNGMSSPAVRVDVIAGTTGNDNISVATLSANLGAATPTFIFGRSGNDVLDGSKMTGSEWFYGGGGADKMTAGTGADNFIYDATSDSTGSSTDIISAFNASIDHLDFTGLGVSLQVQGSIGTKGKNSDTVSAHSVGWQTSGGNTLVYVNTSGSSENISASNMKIELAGSVSLGSGNILHA